MMSESQQQQARRVFMDVAELPESERAEGLSRACGSDDALRAEVEKLLRAERDAGAFLSRPTAGEALKPAGNAALSPNETAGALIGRYKLLEQIGEGGMGTIWMAEQREPVRRRVALKIIKLGMDTKQVIARFEAERQALAMMDHPHIAKVLDAGATETGRPYFVMEYIKGVPILEYCDKERLDTKARLELFTSVCHAIQHAHQKGIIHRDIKPSNVLVTLHDGVPVTKVIDFGIAKATNSELTTKTLFTEHRQMIGTPAYMSPEQAEMSGLDIDTRSDVYSLGVLLYELLTGTVPFDTKALLESGYQEMLRAIREDEPHKPSTRISNLGDTGTRTAQQRRVELRRLSLLLRGDLDWIVMKCLEKDRSRRYDTANGVAADIARHLHDEPITAGAPSASYKLRKFIKRNRTQVIGASAVLTALLVAIVGGSWGLVEKSRARSAVTLRRLEDDQRSAAESARLARNAEAVGALLDQCEEALRSGDASKAKIAIDAARKRAAEGGAEKEAERLSRRAADLDLLVALDAIDQDRWTWTNQDFMSMREAAKRMREPLGKFGADPEVVSVETAVAAVNASAVRGRIVAALDWQLWSRRSEGVRALLRRLDADPFRNEIRDANLSKDTPKFIELMKRPAALEQPPELSAFLGEFNQVDQARRVEMLKAAVLRYPKDISVLMALHRNSSEDWPERLRWSQAAVAAAPTNPVGFNNLGVAMLIGGRLDDAIACFHKAIELGPTLAMPYSNLGNALNDAGHFEESLVNHKKAIELDPNRAETFCSLGGTLSKAGRFDEAVTALRHAIELEPEHVEAHDKLGRTLMSQGKSAEAIESFKRIIALDPKQSRAYGNIGVVLRNLGRLDEAVGWFEQCIALNSKDAVMQSNFSGVLAQLGRIDEAIAMGKRAIESDPKYEMAYYNLGITYKQSSLDASIANLRKAIELDPNHAETHGSLGQALREQGHYEEALAEFKRAHELGSKQPGWKYPSADWVRDAEADVAKANKLQPKLSALLAGEYEPSDNNERLEFAAFCQNKNLNHAATGLYTAALAADTKIGDDLNGCVRYNAACVAVLSAAGQGEDSKNLNEPERARLRKQALDWLRADLNVAAGIFESGKPAERGLVVTALNNFLHQSDLVSIRESAALTRLSADEQQAFTQLWIDMAALLKKAQPPKAKTATDEQAIASFNTRGLTLMSQGKVAEAEQVYAEGLSACQRAFAAPNGLTAILLHHHADALRGLGRLEDALSDARRAVDMYTAHPEASNEGAHALSILQSILREKGRPDEALAARRAWIAQQRHYLPPDSADLANQLRMFSEDLMKSGTLATAREAETVLHECLEIRIKAIPDSWLVHSSRSYLGAAIVRVVDLDTASTSEARVARLHEAEPLLLDAYAGMKADPNVPTPAQSGGADRRREALERVVRLYEIWNRVEPGKGHDAKAAEWRKMLDTASAPVAPEQK